MYDKMTTECSREEKKQVFLVVQWRAKSVLSDLNALFLRPLDPHRLYGISPNDNDYTLAVQLYILNNNHTTSFEILRIHCSTGFTNVKSAKYIIGRGIMDFGVQT